MYPTENLRFVERKGVAPDGQHFIMGRVLQQWWQSEKMIVQGEWRDIPMLPEDNTPPVA